MVGAATGEVRLHDAYSGENMELIDAHSSPVNLLQVCCVGCSLLQLWGLQLVAAVGFTACCRCGG
jgi:hypothetical protein